MSARLPCPPAPGPLEAFSVQFDSLFHTLAQRHGFRTYLAGLLMPRDRSKPLTALVGAEPLIQAQAAEVQQLQFSCPNRPGMRTRLPRNACRCCWRLREARLWPAACW